jgi:site-specific recombinase XerD
MNDNGLPNQKPTGEAGKGKDTDPRKETMLPVLSACMTDLLAAGRSRAELTATFNFFTRYLDENHLAWERFGIREAQGLQNALMARSDEAGNRFYAPATVVKMIGTLKIFYAWARKKHLVAENPFVRVKNVKQPKRLPKDIYELEELEQLLSWLADFGSAPSLKEKRERYLAHVVAELLYSTGLVVGEVKLLKPEDVNLSRRTVTAWIPQYRKHRTAILSEYAAGVLSLFIEELRPVYLASPNYRASRNLLFGTANELTRTVNRVLLQGAAVLNLTPCTTRMFRHALCLHLVKSGCDARFVQELAGHEDLSTTQLYMRLDKRDLRGTLDQFHPRAVLGVREDANA